MRETYGSHLFSTYGFRDAFNPTFTTTSVPVERGSVDPTLGWFDIDYLGIDQGPIIAMIENYRTGLIWRLIRGNAHIVRGLCGRFSGDGSRGSVRPESARHQESRVNSRLGPARERAATPLQRQRRVAASAAALNGPISETTVPWR